MPSAELQEHAAKLLPKHMAGSRKGQGVEWVGGSGWVGVGGWEWAGGSGWVGVGGWRWEWVGGSGWGWVGWVGWVGVELGESQGLGVGLGGGGRMGLEGGWGWRGVWLFWVFGGWGGSME